MRTVIATFTAFMLDALCRSYAIDNSLTYTLEERRQTRFGTRVPNLGGRPLPEPFGGAPVGVSDIELSLDVYCQTQNNKI